MVDLGQKIQSESSSYIMFKKQWLSQGKQLGDRIVDAAWLLKQTPASQPYANLITAPNCKRQDDSLEIRHSIEREILVKSSAI